jgi:hypothetical protein
MSTKDDLRRRKSTVNRFFLTSVELCRINCAVTTSPDITEAFFRWMEEKGVSRAEIAPLLGVDERTLSTYRSRGLPRKKAVRAEAIMREHGIASIGEARSDDTMARIPVHFTDAEYADVQKAAFIVETEVSDFIRRAAIHQARATLGKKSNGTNG